MGNERELKERVAAERESLANLEKAVGECIKEIEEEQRIHLRCQKRLLYAQVQGQRQKVKRLEKELSI